MSAVRWWRPRCRDRLLVVACLALAAAFCVAIAEEVTDFVAVSRLPDGEVETRIYYKGVAAKETSTGPRSASELKFRQLSDGKHLIQLIYDGNELKDCEFGHQKDQVKSFLLSFKNDLSNLIATSNVSIESLDDRGLPREYEWLNYSSLREICHERHLEIKSIMMQSENTNSTQSLRSRRALSDVLRVPGTKWCGKGYSADKYTRLGGFSRTDKCCRRHDTRCHAWIGGFQTKYGLFNWRMNTLMHCRCDEKFRACLKLVGSGDANLVGKLFFNVVQSKCFILKPKKVCANHSWWDRKCTKYKKVKQAVLRDNLPY